MKIKSFLFVLLFGIFFMSCTQEKSTEEYMVDSWETTYMKIEMPTYQKSDSTFVFEDGFKNNPPRRARSTYNKDGTFTAWFVNQENEKKDKTNGKWSVRKDSLFIEFYYTGRAIKVGYLIEKTTKGFIGKSTFDWDADGEFDDFLLMKTKRIIDKK
jgi:hypothetical protein